MFKIKIQNNYITYHFCSELSNITYLCIVVWCLFISLIFVLSEHSLGATVLEYEPTIPAKFMIGTEQVSITPWHSPEHCQLVGYSARVWTTTPTSHEWHGAGTWRIIHWSLPGSHCAGLPATPAKLMDDSERNVLKNPWTLTRSIAYWIRTFLDC